jgi:outer membrane protein insertion porin family
LAPSLGVVASRAIVASLVLFAGVATARAQSPVEPAGVAPGPTLRRIEVKGAWALDTGAIERLLAPADSVDARLGLLAALYADQGFFGATFRVVPDSAAGVVRVHVAEGRETRIAAVHLRGNQVLTEAAIRQTLGLQSGQTYRPPIVEARLDALAEDYARRGYLDAEAVLERCELGDDGVVLGIAMAEGERSQLVEIEVQGNTLTRSELVERLAGLSTPRPADVRRIRDAPQLLLRSGLFAAAMPPQVYRVQGGDVGVVLRVVEAQRRNTAFGAVGMARDPARGRPYLTGGIDLGLRNIFGTGRDLDLEWSRDRILGSRLALGYRERFLFGSPIDLTLGLSQTVRDSSSTWQTLQLAGFLPLNRNLGVEAGGAADRSVYHLGVTGNTLRWRAHVGMKFASLGREEDGVRFGNFEVRAETARRRADLATAGGVDRRSVQQTLWGGRFDFGVPLARRHTLAARGEWHALVSDEPEVPASELFEFGGARTLRGYREGQFKGDQVAYGGLEYRYGDRRAAQGYLFLDAGALRRKQIAAATDESVHVGTGVGMRAQVASGALDVSFGMGEERSFAAVKVHVAFQQRF